MYVCVYIYVLHNFAASYFRSEHFQYTGYVKHVNMFLSLCGSGSRCIMMNVLKRARSITVCSSACLIIVTAVTVCMDYRPTR
jgi:hypothetical protein